MFLFGSVDAEQNIWASVVFGAPGFVSAADEHTLDIDLSRTAYDDRDPFWANLAADRRVGLLAVDSLARKRLRVNGSVRHVSLEAIRLDVLEAYPNCPKYIQRRGAVQLINEEPSDVEPSVGIRPTPGHRALIAAADTFFVASAHGELGVDVSHRGGNPGFVQLLDDRTLRVPDYLGNGMYSTLGNFAANPRAGLLFIDYAANRTLQLVGTPEIRFDLDQLADRTGGTHRYWDFTIDRWLEGALPVHIEWELLDYSPFNPATPES